MIIFYCSTYLTGHIKRDIDQLGRNINFLNGKSIAHILDAKLIRYINTMQFHPLSPIKMTEMSVET